MEYVNKLTKKLFMYESISRELYGIVGMSLDDIMSGIKLMDEQPETIWKSVVKVFGHEFFLPTIDKNYGHLFVSDIKRHQDQVQLAMKDTLKN